MARYLTASLATYDRDQVQRNGEKFCDPIGACVRLFPPRAYRLHVQAAGASVHATHPFNAEQMAAVRAAFGLFNASYGFAGPQDPAR